MQNLTDSQEQLAYESIKEYFSKIQLGYYFDAKQYNHLYEEGVRFPTKTEL